MRTIKPHHLGILTRTFELAGQPYLVLTGLVCTRFDQPRSLVPEADLWKIAAAELTEESGILDEGSAKPCGEVLVNGSCYPRAGEPVGVSSVRIRLGAVDKRLAVFGDRRWKLGVPTEPLPFAEMPLGWSRALGGSKTKANPRGRGDAAVDTPAGAERVLPNVEDPNRLVVGPNDHPAPAGLGAHDVSWPQRASHAGTYDGDWLTTRFPGYPADLDPAFFNMASPDQRISGFFKGDEAFEIENMHPEEPRQTGALPGAVVRMFLRQRGAEGLFEVATRLDTVRLFPGSRALVMVYRAVVPVREDDADDVTDLVAAIEDPTAPRGLDHYAGILARHLDRSRRQRNVQRELLPPRELGWAPIAIGGELERMLRSDGVRAANARKRRADEMDHARSMLTAKGLDPKDFGLDRPPVEDPEPDWNDADAVADYLEKQTERLGVLKQEEEKRAVALEADARKQFTENGIDYDAAAAKAKAENSGPPKFSAAQHVAWMTDMLKIGRDGGSPNLELEALLADPKHRADLVEMEKGYLEQYRTGAHLQPPAPPLDPARSERIRAELEAAAGAGISMAGRDFTGADLSGLRAPGLDFRGALLEATVLTGADLAGANLAGAVLAHARLDRIILAGANLTGANLGAATFDGADLSGADLTDAILARAVVRALDLRGASLVRTVFLETSWQAVPNFAGARLKELVFTDVVLANASFQGARIDNCNFVEVDLDAADFSGATLERVGFLGVGARGASFREARLRGTTFVQATRLDEADFSGADAVGTLFRGTQLSGARFTGAMLDKADLSECRLDGADLSRISARESLFIRADLAGARLGSADLLGALLSKAILRGADLTGASLFRADLSRVRVDGATRLDKANTTQARIYPRATDGQG